MVSRDISLQEGSQFKTQIEPFCVEFAYSPTLLNSPWRQSTILAFISLTYFATDIYMKDMELAGSNQNW